MKTFHSFYSSGLSSFFALCIGLTLTACASLNESECQQADWQIIGLEDGAAGRATAYIGQHRSACAEHGIKPDLARYLKGHQQGLVQFCRYAKGYQLAESGKSRAAACSEAKFSDFVKGYQKGRIAFSLLSDIRLYKDAVEKGQKDTASIKQQIRDKEAALIDDKTGEAVRRKLLNQIKTLTRRLTLIKVQLPKDQNQLNAAEDRYARFTQQR